MLYTFIVCYGEVTQTGMIVATTLIYFINILVFYLYDSLASSYIKIAETTILEKEREFYYHQCSMMQASTEELRAFRHDLKNQLIGVTELIKAGNEENAKKMLETMYEKVSMKTLFSATGNIPIDSIINYKLQNVGNEQIQVETDIRIPADFEIDISDCITILGNLLDNALYALKQVEKSKRYLQLKLVYEKGVLMLRCVNPYVTQVQYENGKIVSAKEDRETHGFGLKNIEYTVKKYNGCMEIQHENHKFVVDILLYLSVDRKK